MSPATYRIEGPAEPRVPLLLDSPHSGHEFPDDFGAAVSEFELRDGEDCFVDELYRPATERGVALLSALVPRTYLDLNRNAGDVDLALVEGGEWPDAYRPSGKARLGKALVWRTLDAGQPIYDRLLPVAEMRRRIERVHRPYHEALQARIAATQARFGASWHIDCHSMNAVSGAQGEGGAGVRRADFVLGDRDGTSCDPAFTEFVRGVLAGMGYEVRVNDPYKGVELVRAYSNPAERRMSLQIEINKRLYMDETTREKSAGFAPLQKNLATLIDAVLEHTAAALRRS
ncbi:MAG TPA: N-formylglutamate amidohydrolase [Caldimonas sp.]|nr:N-formylglutamate amidohydrolase [Caldimonas sp.]HEX2543144.1 N-formylglutamate amidohydrolase [Caldimonas sp.]